MATGGYMLTPVDKDKSFECIICHGLLRDALETPCGHAFCKQCIAKWEQTRRIQLLEMKCPLCNENYDVDKMRRIETINRYIKSQLKVYCPEKESGCKWQGTIDDFEKHESDECLYAVIGCPHEGCDDSAPRREIDSHAKDTCVYRDYECKYCSEVYTFIESGDHLEKCLEAPVHCSNEKCDEELTRAKLEDHLARHCPFEKTACPFLEVGCLTKIEREKIDTHISSHSDHHSKMLLHSFLTIKDILTDTKTELNKTNESLEETKEELDTTKATLTDTTTRLDNSEKEVIAVKNELSDVRSKVFEQLVKDLKYFEEEAEDYAEKFDNLVGFMEDDIYYKAYDRYYIKFSFDEGSIKEDYMGIYVDGESEFQLYKKNYNNVSIQPGYYSSKEIRLLSPEDGWRYGNTKRYLIHPERLEHKESDAHYKRITKEGYTDCIFQNCLLVVLTQL